MTKEEVKEMLETISNKIITEDNKFIDIENSCPYGKNITFKFNAEGQLVEIYS